MKAFKLVTTVGSVLLLVFVFACDRTTTITDVVEAGPVSCFECHSDENTFLVAAEAQWQNSVHASGLRLHQGGRNTCSGCHSHDGFIQRVNGESATGWPNPTVIHCFTCHAPHATGGFGLRWTANATLENGVSFDLNAGNLCVACHHARRDVGTYITDPEPITSTHWGPHHGVQGDNLIGSNAYLYDGFNYTSTAHRSATRDGCVDCHKNNATSNNVVGGHSFNMRATLAGSEITNEAACEVCHADIDDFDYHGVQTLVDSLVTQLETLVEGADMLHDGHPNSGVTVSADSAGALWNLLMVEEDRSHGIHNPKHLIGILESSILFLSGQLPQSAPPAYVRETDGPRTTVLNRK